MSLDLEFVDNVAVLRFDDGKRNVFSSDVIADFNAALMRLRLAPPLCAG